MFSKSFFGGIVFLILAAFTLSARAAERVVNLTFVVFSDIYEMAERDGRGGP